MYAKIIIFIIFLLFGFAMMAGMVHAFIFLQEKIGNGNIPIIKFLKDHVWTFIYAVWVFLLFGLAVALPAMIKDGFFADETSMPANKPQSTMNPPNKAPSGALPPLEYQINAADIIALAKTSLGEKSNSYIIVDFIKQRSVALGIEKDEPLEANVKMFTLLGYKPQQDEEVILFFEGTGMATKEPFELLPLVNGKIVYGKDDPTVKQELTLEEFRTKVSK